MRLYLDAAPVMYDQTTARRFQVFNPDAASAPGSDKLPAFLYICLFTDRGRREVIQAWQRRKQTEVKHALFKQNVRLGQVFSIQAKLLARKLRGDVPDYIPFIPK